MWRIVCLLSGVVLGGSVHAAGPVYKCSQEGKTILTDHACGDVNAMTSTTPPANVAASSTPEAPADQLVYGEWRGPVQTHAMRAGKAVPGDHEVVPFTLKVSGDGTFTGIASELGCKFLGLATPFPGVPSALQLDVTTTGCNDPVFNARYQGNLTRQASSTAILLLNAVYSASPSQMIVAEFKSILRR